MNSRLPTYRSAILCVTPLTFQNVGDQLNSAMKHHPMNLQPGLIMAPALAKPRQPHASTSSTRQCPPIQTTPAKRAEARSRGRYPTA